MNKVILLFPLILLFSLEIKSYSKEPSPPIAKGQVQPGELKSKSATSHNIKPNENDNNTQKSVSLTTKLDTRASNAASEKTDKKNSNADPCAVNDDPIVIYTWWLMFFTGLLVGCNVLLWLYTKKAADAAKRSADILPTLEKAYVIVMVNTADYKKMELGGHGADVSVCNDGKTPATILKCRAILLCKEDSLNMEGSDILPGAELGSSKVITIPLRLTTDEVKRTREKASDIFCHVIVEYEDIFQNRYAKRLTWEYKSNISIPEGYWQLCDNKKLTHYVQC